MSTTLTLDPSGALVIPPEMLEGTPLSANSRVEVEQTAAGLFLKPAVETAEYRLVRNEYGDLVIESGRRITDEEVIAALAADRK